MTDNTFRDIGKGRLQRGQIRKNHQRGQGHNDPGPGPERIMGDIEQKGCPHGMFLVFGCQHALSNISAPTRFCPGIPHAPPLHSQGNDKDGHQERCVGKIRKNGKLIADIHMGEQVSQSPHLGQGNRNISSGHCSEHGNEKLNKIGD